MVAGVTLAVLTTTATARAITNPLYAPAAASAWNVQFNKQFNQRFNVRFDARWRRTHPPMNGPAVASWYYDAGTTGCGFHATYGIATFVVPCGGHVTLRYAGRTITATRDDSGPYVAGRLFDLGPTAKAALGCPDLCDVMWR